MTEVPTINNFAETVLDGLLERHPDVATSLGDPRYDDRLPDLSRAAADDEAQWIDRCLTVLDTYDTAAMETDDRVDADVPQAHLDLLIRSISRLRRENTVRFSLVAAKAAPRSFT